MKTFLEKVRAGLAAFGRRFKRQPKAPAAVHEPNTKPRVALKLDRFTVISWAVTVVIVAALLGAAVLYRNSQAASPSVMSIPTSQPAGVSLPLAQQSDLSPAAGGVFAISRKLQLKTNIPERPRYEPLMYRVSRGDSMWQLADTFKLKSESILFANPDMGDNPHNLKPGMELSIPPLDGLYYEWQDGDTFETVADEFGAKADDIINFPGNKVDLTDPQVNIGQVVLIPGGARELRNWAADLQTAGRGANTGTGGATASNACGGGPVATGYGWPADDHSLSGNPYGPSHLGIDISAPEGSNVYAAGSGVVTMAQGGWNYGYGNVVQIDHGNGDVTVYAHLSSYMVGMCQFVGQGAVVGYSGNTGNSFGAHLHFEIRRGGSNINPYDIVQ